MLSECLHDYPHADVWCENHRQLLLEEVKLKLEVQRLEEQRRTNDLLEMQLEDQGIYKPRRKTYTPPEIIEPPRTVRRKT
jgi:hypothetical protein